MNIIPEIAARHAEHRRWRHEIHAQPELAYEEHQTADLVVRELTAAGIPFERGLGRTGVVATIEGRAPGKRIGLRADMDALPLQEMNDFAHRSQRAGVMHACGHDGHTVMLLAAAEHLARHRDFDGTIHEDFATPRIPHALQEAIAAFQARGGLWVINTGREMASLMESLGRGHVAVQPDYLILVEREIYRRDHGRYVPVEPWNGRCTADHAELFRASEQPIRRLMESLSERFDATFYQDAFSPLCVIARSNPQMDAIQAELDAFCAA